MGARGDYVGRSSAVCLGGHAGDASTGSMVGLMYVEAGSVLFHAPHMKIIVVMPAVESFLQIPTIDCGSVRSHYRN